MHPNSSMSCIADRSSGRHLRAVPRLGRVARSFARIPGTGQGRRLDKLIVEHDEPPDELIPRRVAMGSVWFIQASQEPDILIFVDQGQERLFRGCRKHTRPGLALASSTLTAGR